MPDEQSAAYGTAKERTLLVIPRQIPINAG